MSNIWFTGDTHFGHAGILKHQDRPWKTVEEHDFNLCLRWNSLVQKGLGYIIGGNCDRLHRERAYREAYASKEVIEMLLYEGYVVPYGKGKYCVNKLPKSFGWEKVAAFGNGNVQREIAAWRVLSDLLPVLRKQKKVFTLKELKALSVDIQKFTFELGGTLDPIRIVGSYGQPHCSKIYEGRKKKGHFSKIK